MKYYLKAFVTKKMLEEHFFDKKGIRGKGFSWEHYVDDETKEIKFSRPPYENPKANDLKSRIQDLVDEGLVRDKECLELHPGVIYKIEISTRKIGHNSPAVGLPITTFFCSREEGETTIISKLETSDTSITEDFLSHNLMRLIMNVEEKKGKYGVNKNVD